MSLEEQADVRREGVALILHIETKFMELRNSLRKMEFTKLFTKLWNSLGIH